MSLNTFVNNFGRLAPFSTVAWLPIEIKQWSLDPFRKMFKRQKHYLGVQLTYKNFTADA